MAESGQALLSLDGPKQPADVFLSFLAFEGGLLTISVMELQPLSFFPENHLPKPSSSPTIFKPKWILQIILSCIKF